MVQKFLNGDVVGLNITEHNGLIYCIVYSNYGFLDNNVNNRLKGPSLYLLVFKNNQLVNCNLIVTFNTNNININSIPTFILKLDNDNNIFGSLTCRRSVTLNDESTIDVQIGTSLLLLLEFNCDLKVKNYYGFTTNNNSPSIYPLNFVIINGLIYFIGNFNKNLIGFNKCEKTTFKRDIENISVFFGVWTPNFNSIGLKYIQEDNNVFSGQIVEYKDKLIITGTAITCGNGNTLKLDNNSILFILEVTTFLNIENIRYIYSCKTSDIISNLSIVNINDNIFLAGNLVGCFNFKGVEVDTEGVFLQYVAIYDGEDFLIHVVNPGYPYRSNNTTNMVYLSKKNNNAYFSSHYWLSAKIPNNITLEGEGSQDLYVLRLTEDGSITGYTNILCNVPVGYNNLLGSDLYLSTKVFNDNLRSLSIFDI